jgi:hypothetical protein
MRNEEIKMSSDDAYNLLWKIAEDLTHQGSAYTRRQGRRMIKALDIIEEDNELGEYNDEIQVKSRGS